MSTAYHPICLSHPTALVLDEVGDRDRRDAIAAAVDLPGHRECDIVLGGYSYPLVTIGCLPHATFGHREVVWIHPGWLRLLLWARRGSVAETPDADAVERHVRGAAACWPPERLTRLANVLEESS